MASKPAGAGSCLTVLRCGALKMSHSLISPRAVLLLVCPLDIFLPSHSSSRHLLCSNPSPYLGSLLSVSGCGLCLSLGISASPGLWVTPAWLCPRACWASPPSGSSSAAAGTLWAWDQVSHPPSGVSQTPDVAGVHGDLFTWVSLGH